MTRPTAIRLAAIAAILAPLTGSAFELADGKLNLRGNGSWSYQVTDEDGYLRGDPDGDWDTALFDLAVIARPADDLSVNAQLSFRPLVGESESGETTDAGLDWAFIDWRLSDAFRIRAGKVKQPFGNYAEIQSVGTIRPLYDLATAVYGPANIAAVAYQGVGFTGDLPFGDAWSVQYDLWGGSVFLDSYEPFDWFNGEFAPGSAEYEAAPAVEIERVENIFGGRLSLATPWNWTFRFSAYGGKTPKDEGEDALVFYADGLSAWYRGEKLWVSAEGFYSREQGFESTWSGYAEAAWFLTPKVQVAGRYELSRTSAEGIEGDLEVLGEHDAVTLGVNYWISPLAVIKGSVDWVRGSRFAVADAWEEWDSAVQAPLPTDQLFRFVVGTQFSF